MVFKFCMNGYLQYLKPALRPGGIRSNRRCLLNGPGQGAARLFRSSAGAMLTLLLLILGLFSLETRWF